ncbi:MAG: hypothetical protein K2X09_03645 [Rickettsiales bacterium]|nr:hypothetical protein [Rickettsiales bacterium]
MLRICIIVAITQGLLIFMFTAFDRQSSQPLKIISDEQSATLKEAMKP